MVAVPTLWNVTTFPLTVHTSGVLVVKVTVSPESELALSVRLVPKFCAPGFANVMVCAALGVTLLDAADAVPVPALFVAVTVNVYACPLVSPVTVIGLPAHDTGATSAGLHVTVYPVIDVPPVKAGGVKLMLTCVSPAVATTFVGAPGTTAFTVKDLETVVAGRYSSFPA